MNMNMNGISVIIPTHNDGEYLERSIGSVLMQKCNVPIEIVLVNDCSTKAPPLRVLNLIHENRGMITGVRHEINKGLAASRNTGIAAAKYDWIIPLDADDYFIQPQSLQILLNKSIYADVVGGNVFVEEFQCIFEISDPRLFSIDEWKKRNLWYNTSLIRKSAIQSVGGYQVKIEKAYYEDWNLWVRMWKTGLKFQKVPQTIYGYAFHPNNDNMCKVLDQQREHYVNVTLEGLL